MNGDATDVGVAAKSEEQATKEATEDKAAAIAAKKKRHGHAGDKKKATAARFSTEENEAPATTQFKRVNAAHAIGDTQC